MYRHSKGFTLIELVVAILLMSLVGLAVMSIIRSNLLISDRARQLDGQVAELFNDIKTNIVLAQTITSTPESITITRIDGCQVSYSYDNRQQTVRKSVVNCSGQKSLIVGNVSDFSVQADSNYPDTYIITLQRSEENFTHSIKVKKP